MMTTYTNRQTDMTTTARATSNGAPIFDVIQSWGVASARHTSGCVVYPEESASGQLQHGHLTSSSPSSSSLVDDNKCGSIQTEYLFDVPIGPSIIRWDFETKKRLLQFQAHCDAVTSMRMSPDRRYIATSCFSGEVKLWSPRGWACLDHVTAPMMSQHHVGCTQCIHTHN